MFTVKFINLETKDDSEVTHSIQCPHYSSYQMQSGAWAITVFKDMFSNEGVEWTVSKHIPKGFDVCFVENASGKTVARFSAED